MPPPQRPRKTPASEAGGLRPTAFQFIAYDEVDSTNTVAKRLCAAGAGDRTLVWARRQTAGRGRLQRTWISPEGNLYVSLILRPKVPAREATALTFVAAVAVADAVAALLPDDAPVRCKWPNDVLVGGKKIAGILLESAITADGSLEWVIVGIGINVAAHPPASEIIYPATSLAAAGAAATVLEDVLDMLCQRLDHWLRRWTDAGFAAVRAAWMARAHELGRPIAVGCGGEPVRGVFRGLDEDGTLVIEGDDGIRRISVGDVLPNQPSTA